MENIFERYEKVKKNIILLYQRKLWEKREMYDIDNLKININEFLVKILPRISALINEEIKKYAKDRKDILNELEEQLRLVNNIKSYCDVVSALHDKNLIFSKLQKLFEAFGFFIKKADEIVALSKITYIPKRVSLEEKLKRAS